MALNQWYNVALTYSPGVIRLYIDGSLVNEGNNASGNIINNDGDLWIGRYHDYDNHFPGYIDQVSIWADALTESEIQENMYNDLIGFEDGLVGYWSFNDGNGDVLTDFSGNGNHGTINGATWSDDVPQPPHTGPEWYVSESGSDENNGSPDYPFATIQHAINSANENDSIFVGPGTYVENINLSGKSLGLISTDGPESTIIDGDQNGRVVTLDNPNNNDIYNRISGFTIQNGSWNGAGAWGTFDRIAVIGCRLTYSCV